MAHNARSNTLKGSITIALMCASLFAHATDSLVSRIPLVYTYFTTDAYNNIYAITPDQEIVRTDILQTRRVTFSNLRYGIPTFVDAGNPLKTLVYYSEQQTLVILDKMLADIAVLRFSALNGNAYQPTLLCRASGGDHIWMFDDLSQRVMRLDEAGNMIAMSEPWYQLFNTMETPLWMKSVNDQVFIYTSNHQLHVFDTFATLGNSYSLATAPSDIYNGMVLMNDTTGAYLFDPATGRNIPIGFPLQNATLRMQPQYLFAGYGDHIDVISFAEKP